MRYAVLLCAAAVLLLSDIPSAGAQAPDRIATGFTIHQIADQIEGGIGWEAAADYRIAGLGDNTLFVRPEVEFLSLFPYEDELISVTYRRYYGSLALLVERRMHEKLFPFIEAGGGFVKHQLVNPRSKVGYRSREETIDDRFAYHTKAGVRGVMSRRVSIVLGVKWLFQNTEHTITQTLDVLNETETFVTPVEWNHAQFSFNVMFSF